MNLIKNNNVAEQTENNKVNSCPEFPYFGAKYPDATCIDGYLWDLDSHEKGKGLTQGGDEPCPFCNKEKFMIQQEDNEVPKEEVLEWIESIRKRYS